MTDPLAQVIAVLRPRAVFSKGITGAGRWAVRYSAFGHPGFCAITEGRCRLSVDGAPPVVLEQGDFVLLPATPAFTMSGMEPAPPRQIDAAQAAAEADSAEAGATEVRHGRRDGPPDVRQLGGYFTFATEDARLLVSLLPRMIHLRGMPRLTSLVQMLGEEAAGEAAGRGPILTRLVEILLIEALRAAPSLPVSPVPVSSASPDSAATAAAGIAPQPGLLSGLADARVSVALRQMHGDIARSWTIDSLARAAGMSRSAFFDRFLRTTGMRPAEYLQLWRMALARDMLRRGTIPIDEVARAVGYGSASTFSTAFSRHTGMPPGRFMRQAAPLSAHIGAQIGGPRPHRRDTDTIPT